MSPEKTTPIHPMYDHFDHLDPTNRIGTEELLEMISSEIVSFSVNTVHTALASVMISGIDVKIAFYDAICSYALTVDGTTFLITFKNNRPLFFMFDVKRQKKFGNADIELEVSKTFKRFVPVLKCFVDMFDFSLIDKVLYREQP